MWAPPLAGAFYVLDLDITASNTRWSALDLEQLFVADVKPSHQAANVERSYEGEAQNLCHDNMHDVSSGFGVSNPLG